MDVLIRELRREAGIEEYRDTTFHGESLLIGSAADAGVQIIGEKVAARHAALAPEGAQLQLRCERGLLAQVNGTPTAAALLQVGDVVQIGGNRLRLVAAPAGFQFALEIEPDASVDAGHFEAAFRTSLEQTIVSKRRLSWIAFGAVVALGLLVPLAFVMLDADPPTGQGTPAGFLSRNFGDALWSTGPLAPVHAQATGNQCKHCHQNLFVRVRDTACRACHLNVADHVPPGIMEDGRAGHEAVQGRCGSCHREHGETHASLVLRADSLCTSCHADASERFASLGLPDATAFDEQNHPAFSPLMLVPDAAAASGWGAHRVVLANAIDQSNLKFSHEQHLDGEQVVRKSDGGALGCTDCHRPTAGGERFEKVTMRDVCSSCHEMTFDPAEPQRQLPHGATRDAVLALQEFYARRYLDPAAAPVPRQKRRIPGRSEEQAQSPCTDSALSCARQYAAEEIEGQFTERGCVTCHEVRDTGAASLLERFEVLPARLADSYFPSARFDHAAHRIQKDLTGDAACLSCHRAAQSTQSSEVLLPDLPRCAGCHRTQATGAQIPSPCISCHLNHPPEGLARSTDLTRVAPL